MQFSLRDNQDSPAANTRGAKFRRSQIFSRLPDEILENIFLMDVLDHKDLCALTLVNHRTSSLAKVSLYNQVALRLLGAEYIYFRRTLLEHPELAS
jgi:hypothetical protein